MYVFIHVLIHMFAQYGGDLCAKNAGDTIIYFVSVRQTRLLLLQLVLIDIPEMLAVNICHKTKS